MNDAAISARVKELIATVERFDRGAFDKEMMARLVALAERGNALQAEGNEYLRRLVARMPPLSDIAVAYQQGSLP